MTDDMSLVLVVLLIEEERRGEKRRTLREFEVTKLFWSEALNGSLVFSDF